MVDLINELTELDKQRLHNYICKWGVVEEKFMGIDKWLQNWSHSKQTLYKLLGNQLTYEVDYNYTQSKDELRNEFDRLLEHRFVSRYEDFLWEIRHAYTDFDFWDLYFMKTGVFMEDKIGVSFKIKLPGFNKTLQLQPEMKPIRALQKIAGYFQNTEFSRYFNELEDFRIKHSMITNGVQKKTLKFVVSIHPLDFITMSDNSLDWTSCMAWAKEDRGCYSIGTVEMMNSNNVVCCYIKSEEPYYFDPDHQDNTHVWNNKKWRCLGYYTKDIIMSGKAYPYQCDDHKKFLIKVIKDLAEKNLGRTYSFGPELYQDMIHTQSLQRMQKNHEWVKEGSDFKHSILFDTKGMYNDMFNDTYCHYWCYRNKVNKMKFISLSGKAPCLCCGKQVPVFDEDEEYYNDRYYDVGQVICSDCMDKIDCCEVCGEKNPIYRHKKIYFKKEGQEKAFCQRCYDKYFRICPCCGDPFYVKNYWLEPQDFNRIKDPNETSVVGFFQPEELGTEYEPYGTTKTRHICVCPKCKENGSYKSVMTTTIFERRNWFGDYLEKVEVPALLPGHEEYFFGNLKHLTKDITEI